MLDWKSEIVRNCYWKQIAHDADGALTWRVPKVAAKSEAITAAEHVLGFGFPGDYRDFLRHADGWPWFLNETDLFGTPDFLSGRAARFLQRPGLVGAMAKLGFQPREYIPIGAGDPEVDQEVFLLVRPGASILPGGVVWFDPECVDGVLDKYASFEEFFVSVIGYNEIIAKKAVSDAKRQ